MFNLILCKMKNDNVQEAVKTAELPNWEEFVSMVENEVSQKSSNTIIAYYVYTKYSKSC